MIRLALFGGIELVDPANPHAPAVLGQRKSLALLVYLALAGPGAFRSRDAVLALFWPESDDRRARHSLNSALHRLRTSLGPGVIVGRRDGDVGTSPDALWCDAVAFEQALKSDAAEEALCLYRGDLLPSFFVDDAPGFERWLDEERPRFGHMARDAAWRLAEQAESRSEPAAAARWARRSSELSHDDEASLQQLIMLLDRVGDHAGALHAYHEFAERLRKEFGVAPSKETERLIAMIRANGEAPAGRPSTPPNIGTPPAPTAHSRQVNAHERASPSPVTGDPSLACTTAWPLPTPVAPLLDRGRHRLGERSLIWLSAAILSVASFAGLGAFLHYAERPMLGAERPSRVRIVVDDFTDLTTPSRSGVLGPAITAALVGQLAAVRSFDVASRSLAGRPSDADKRGAASPRFLVTGSVLHSGARVRVNVELIDAVAGSTLGSAVLDHLPSDSIALVDVLSRDVSTMVRVGIGRELRERGRYAAGVDPQARRLAGEADAERERAHVLEREGRFPTAMRALRRANDLLAKAEGIAPEWRALMLERAHVAWELAVLHFTPGSRDLVRAEALLSEGIAQAERAMASDRDDATALETLGLLSYWYWLKLPLAPDSSRATLTRAGEALRRAVEIDPDRAPAWNLLSAVLYSQADYSGAYLAADRAYSADAYLDDAEEILNRLFLAAYEIGNDAGARRWCDAINLRFQRSWTGAYCRLGLLAWDGTAGDPAAARRAWAIAAEGGRRTALASATGPRLYMLVAATLARAGLRDSAEAMIRRSRAHSNGDPELLPLEASAQLLLGRPDTAIARLAEYVRGKPSHRAAVACSRRFVALHALDRQRALFGPCAASVESRALRPALYAGEFAPGSRDAVYLAVDQEADALVSCQDRGTRLAVH